MSECKFAVEAFHAYIESIGLSRPAGTLGELKAFKAGADWQRSLAQPQSDLVPVFQIWRSTDSCCEFWSWDDVDEDEYADEPEPTKKRKLYAAPAQPQSDDAMDGLVDAVKDVLDHLNDGHSIHSGTGLHSCLQAAYRALRGGDHE